jgi:hypothetical protein
MVNNFIEKSPAHFFIGIKKHYTHPLFSRGIVGEKPPDEVLM